MIALDQIDDPDLLRKHAQVLQGQLEFIQKRNKELAEELARLKGLGQLELEVVKQAEQLAKLRHKIFGESSERRPSPHPPGVEPSKPKTGHGPTPQLRLPTREEHHRLGDDERTCPACITPVSFVSATATSLVTSTKSHPLAGARAFVDGPADVCRRNFHRQPARVFALTPIRFAYCRQLCPLASRPSTRFLQIEASSTFAAVMSAPRLEDAAPVLPASSARSRVDTHRRRRAPPTSCRRAPARRSSPALPASAPTQARRARPSSRHMSWTSILREGLVGAHGDRVTTQVFGRIRRTLSSVSAPTSSASPRSPLIRAVCSRRPAPRHDAVRRTLTLQQHAALAQRVMLYAPLVAKTDPALVSAMLDHGLAAAGAPPDLITPDARAMLIRVSRGIPRLVSHLLRIALVLADDRAQPTIDASLVNSAVVLLHLESPNPPVVPPPKPRFDRDPRSRA